MKIKPDEEVMKMRKLALVEDTIRECDLILQMRKSANKLIENREMVKDLEAEILESQENAYNDIKAGLVGIYYTNHLEKALDKAKAKSSATEAEHRLFMQECADFPSILSIVFKAEPDHPFQIMYNSIRAIASSERALTSAKTNERLCLSLHRIALTMIKYQPTTRVVTTH
jgi:hypothetical protein